MSDADKPVIERLIKLEVNGSHLREDLHRHEAKDDVHFSDINKNLHELGSDLRKIEREQTKISTQLLMVGLFLTLVIPTASFLLDKFLN